MVKAPKRSNKGLIKKVKKNKVKKEKPVEKKKGFWATLFS